MKILSFAGSLRKESINKNLAVAAAELAKKHGAEAQYIDLKDYPIPHYDGDIEGQGFPESAARLKQLLVDADGLIICSPEYNSGISGVLKDVIDWCSRPTSDSEPSLQAFNGKVALLLSSSPGGMGGLRGLAHLRWILGNIGVIVLPDQLAIGKANASSVGQDKRLEPMVKKLVETTSKLQH